MAIQNESRARVAIIGAGIVGCSLADELSQRGETDIIVLEQGPLFTAGGSTSHAPGLVFQTNPSKMMTNLASYTVKRFSELTLDGEPCFYGVGGIELATTPERWDELQRRSGLAASWGVEKYLLSSSEVKDLEPLLDTTRIYGGLHTPHDGIAKALRGAEAMAREAQSRGVRFYGHTPVTGLDIRDGRVHGVHTSEGTIEAEIVVNCAGMWGPTIGNLAGVSVPLQPMQHQLAYSSSVPSLAGEAREVSAPIMRHQDFSMYWRRSFDELWIGAYRHAAMPVSSDAIGRWEDQSEEMPSILPFTEQDFQPTLDEAHKMLPALQGVGMRRGINGLFSFMPDGGTALGESPVRGFWIANAVWITHSAGTAKSVAELILEGASEIDVSGGDVNRFDAYARTSSYVRQRSSQAFLEVYDIIHPQAPPKAEFRPVRTSPFYLREKELGAYFLEASGWERPQWYEANEALLERYASQITDRDEWSGRYWNPLVGAEHLALRDSVGMVDMTSLKQVEVSGPGALWLLQYLTTGEMDKPVGKVTYTLMLDSNAGVKSDITVARVAHDRFRVGVNSPSDIAWLQKHNDRGANIQELTPGSCCVGLWGPYARHVLQSLSPDDVSNEAFRFFNASEIYVGDVPVTALRVSYVGELGWELYTTADLGLRLWDLLWQAGQPYGIIAAGRGAFDSMRVEKGFRSYGKDMTTEHYPDEAGLGFAVHESKLNNGFFMGRCALLERRGETPRQQLCCLVLANRKKLVMGSEPVYSNGGDAVGYVTSSAHGYSIGESIAYAWLPPELAETGTDVQIEYFGERLIATVANEPLFDPRMERMRA